MLYLAAVALVAGCIAASPYRNALLNDAVGTNAISICGADGEDAGPVVRGTPPAALYLHRPAPSPTSLIRRAVRNISQLADVATESCGEAGRVEVRIWYDRTDPPVGRLWRVSDPPSDRVAVSIRFSGWLGLLRALSDALGEADDEQRRS